ncbi:MAG: hypothetical protein LBR37_00180 [Erysipelotrichaceae bacterium]|jgi:hypothetical protein|nr:hypothetical protein [Erysipelotrichaceae bacterium]
MKRKSIILTLSSLALLMVASISGVAVFNRQGFKNSNTIAEIAAEESCGFYVVGKNGAESTTFKSEWHPDGGHPLVVNPNPDTTSFPNLVAEWYITELPLSVADQFKIRDYTGDTWIEYYVHENDGMTHTVDIEGEDFGNVHVNTAASYDIYLKHWDDTADGIGDAYSVSILKHPVPQEWYLVGVGSFLTGTETWVAETGIALTLNDNPAVTPDLVAEYYALEVAFEVGDMWKAFEATEDRWDAIVDTSTGLGSAFDYNMVHVMMEVDENEGNVYIDIAGTYNIYVKLWADNAVTVFIAPSEAPVLDAEYYLIGSFSNWSVAHPDAISLEENPDATLLDTQTGEYMALGIDFEVGAEMKIWSKTANAFLTVGNEGDLTKVSGGNESNFVITLTDTYNVYLKTWLDGGFSVYFEGITEVTTYDYYLVGSFSDWGVNANAIGLIKNPDNPNEYMATGVPMAAATEFKIHNGTSFYNVSLNGASATGVSGGGSSNFLISTAGNYDFYYNHTNWTLYIGRAA